MSAQWLRGLDRRPSPIAAISFVSGVGAALAGASPTGSTVVDVVIVGTAAGAATWAAARAPWWAVSGACAIAAVGATPTWLLVLMAVAGLVLTARLNVAPRQRPVNHAVATLLAVQVLARLDLAVFQGWSSLVACGTLGVLAIIGVRKMPRGIRLIVRRTVIGVGATGFAAVVLFAMASLQARTKLEEANRQTRVGLDAVNRGEFQAAQTAFARAADAFDSADASLRAFWAQPARLVPIVAQNRVGAVTLTAVGRDTLRRAAESVGKLDQDSVRVINGRIDIEAVRAFEQPFVELRDSIAQLSGALTEANSDWLVGPFRDRLRSIAAEVDQQTERADNAIEAVRLAPDMLGANGPRRYFIGFTTPAEARGGSGFMGNWAEVTADDGVLTMTEFGRHTQLRTNTSVPNGRRLTASPDVAGVYGGYGFVSGEDGTASPDVWEIVTMIPDYPTVAGFIAELYPQSGGEEVDGVFLLDPHAVAELIGFTGPIRIDGIGTPITRANAAAFIESDQYLVEATDDRVELLDEIARTAVERLLSSTLPPPTDLARAFGPLAIENRFLAWSRNANEQALFSTVGMSGAFPELTGGDGLVVTVDNGGGNKIDAYLDVATDYRYGQPDADGVIHATVSVTLTNSAPAEGLPPYVIGNSVDLPSGTNRLLLSVYSALASSSASVNGEDRPLRTGRVFGWNSATTVVEVPPMSSRTVTFTLSGTLDRPRARFVTAQQPMVREPKLTVARG